MCGRIPRISRPVKDEGNEWEVKLVDDFQTLGVANEERECRLPNELLEKIFDQLDSLLNKRDFYRLGLVSRRFHSLAIRFLYLDIEFSNPRRFFAMRDAWRNVPPLYAPCTTTLSLGDTLTRGWSAEFDPFWNHVEVFAVSLSSLHLLSLNRLDLSFSFFKFATGLGFPLAVQLSYCLVNREALLAVPTLNFNEISITMISWQETATSLIQEGGQIISELIFHCRHVRLAQFRIDQSLVRYIRENDLTWPPTLCHLEIYTDWADTREDQTLMGLTITRIIRACSPLDYLSLPNSSDGFRVLARHILRETIPSTQLHLHADINQLEAPPQFLALIHPDAGIETLDIGDGELTRNLLSTLPIWSHVRTLTFGMADISIDEMDYLAEIFPRMENVTFISLRNHLTVRDSFEVSPKLHDVTDGFGLSDESTHIHEPDVACK
ncbi:uncharacterized protein C8R40DRAFT_1164279 [Lentinula edodes]|uniref:uncharacterized protein n=1 Tax=Lentinula edodes TaxID=5353 RepID=UPI001E8E0E7A|nr:uncharacterized protein C8R40DRAFT_1164279 [Lentinula edodes]KAH7880844.1 hypothetical protein C8R40DRAFT_1164279 [Lentinula edodes]